MRSLYFIDCSIRGISHLLLKREKDITDVTKGEMYQSKDQDRWVSIYKRP